MASLLKQAEATEKLEMMSALVKERKEELDSELRHHQNALEHMESPLDSSHHLARLVLRECKALASAKRPLWLAWRNDDALADRLVDCSTHEIIFKNGDGALRNDWRFWTVHFCRSSPRHAHTTSDAYHGLNMEERGSRLPAQPVQLLADGQECREHNYFEFKQPFSFRLA